MASDRPTVYATLMNEAVAEAEQFRERFMGGGAIADLVAPACRGQFEDVLKHGLRQVYVAGVTHGYQQAAQAFDDRQDALAAAASDPGTGDRPADVDDAGFGEE